MFQSSPPGCSRDSAGGRRAPRCGGLVRATRAHGRVAPRHHRAGGEADRRPGAPAASARRRETLRFRLSRAAISAGCAEAWPRVLDIVKRSVKDLAEPQEHLFRAPDLSAGEWVDKECLVLVFRPHDKVAWKPTPSSETPTRRRLRCRAGRGGWAALFDLDHPISIGGWVRRSLRCAEKPSLLQKWRLRRATASIVLASSGMWRSVASPSIRATRSSGSNQGARGRQSRPRPGRAGCARMHLADARQLAQQGIAFCSDSSTGQQ